MDAGTGRLIAPRSLPGRAAGRGSAHSTGTGGKGGWHRMLWTLVAFMALAYAGMLGYLVNTAPV
jgi:hypothetical protein